MNKKFLKYIIIFVVIVLICVFSFFIYKNLFSDSGNVRYKDIDKHKLTNNEINSVKDKIKEWEEIKKVDIYTDSKIIKIVVKLNNDIDFEKVKEKANGILTEFNEKNLEYYDIEFFVASATEESQVYPQIGYKFKNNLEFSW